MTGRHSISRRLLLHAAGATVAFCATPSWASQDLLLAMRNVAALRAEHLVRQIPRLFLGAPRRRRQPSKTEVRPRSRHPHRHPLSTGHRRGAPTAVLCVRGF
jgi:hypothetical protein